MKKHLFTLLCLSITMIMASCSGASETQTQSQSQTDEPKTIQLPSFKDDGVKHTFEDLNVPTGVERLIHEDLHLHRDQTAFDINPNYVTLKRFLELKKEQAMAQYDPLAAMFFETVL